jgi:hypothetical protein
MVIVETASVRLDEFNGVGDQLKIASLSALVRFPFLLIKCSDNRYAGSLVKILFCDFSKLVEAGDFDPIGLFL